MHFVFWLPVILIGGMLRVATRDAENVISADEQIEPRISSGSIAHRAGALTIQRGQS